MQQCDRHTEFCSAIHEINSKLDTLIEQTAVYKERSEWFRMHIMGLWTVVATSAGLVVTAIGFGVSYALRKFG